jgi:hypothetical protein
MTRAQVRVADETAGAVRIAGAYWTGRRAGADEIAEIIAAAAGLPPLRPRKQVIGPDTVRPMLIFGVVLAGLAVALNALFGTSAGFPHLLGLAGFGVGAVGVRLFLPAAAALIDYRRHPSPPGR